MPLDDAAVEVFVGGPPSNRTVCAAHPASRFDAGTVELLAGTTDLRVVCVNPQGVEQRESAETPSLDRMVDRLEEVRRDLGLGRWIFWGMSGGGWLAQIYGYRYPESLAAVVIESACLCFRQRLADPDCALSPFFPAWRERLQVAGLLSTGAHTAVGSSDDTEWTELEGVGQVYRRRAGPALLVSPAPLDPEMKRMMPRFWEFDSRHWIGSIRVPTLVLCGSSDPVVPARHARAVHEAIAGSWFVEIPGGGHVAVTERRPEVREAFRRFLE